MGCIHILFPANTVCRASAGACDVAEVCDGASPTCPPDGFAGTSVVCRPPATPCDVQETCTGTSAMCPADAKLPDGTSCSDGNACTLNDHCAGEACSGDPALADGNPCTTGTGQSGHCSDGVCK